MDLESLKKIKFLWHHDSEYIYAVYRRYVRSRKDLKNGWRLVVLKNRFAVFYNEQTKETISFPCFRRVFVANDGKFMVKLKKRGTAIFFSNGESIAPFDEQNKLYRNGWYRIKKEDGFELYNEKNNCLGTKLRATDVFKNGQYFMSVTQAEDETKAGLFNAEGKKLLFCNATRYKILPNGWFVVEHQLFDNNGKLYCEPMYGRKVCAWLLYLTGFFMKKQI